MRVVAKDVATATGLADAGTVDVTGLDIPKDADRVYVLIDDNAGGVPAAYDLSVTVDGDKLTESNLASKTKEAATDSSTEVAPFGGVYDVVVTNNSGGAADYRVQVVALKSTNS